MAVEPPPPRLLRRRPAIEIQLQPETERAQASHHHITRKQHRSGKQNEFAAIEAGSEREPGSPAAARCGRRTPPPATSSSGSGRCGRSPSRPRSSNSPPPSSALSAAAPSGATVPRQPPPIGVARGPWVCPGQSRRRSAGRAASRAPPAGGRTLGSTPPHRPAPPRIDSSPPRNPLALAPRPATATVRLARAGRIGPNPTALLSLFPVSSSPRRSGEHGFGVKKTLGARPR